MKKSTILIIHVLTWVVVIVVMFLNAWLGSTMIQNTEVVSFGDAFRLLGFQTITSIVFIMVIFYMFYFTQPKFFVKRNYVYKIGPVSLLIVILIGIYLYTIRGAGQMVALGTLIRGFWYLSLTAILGSLYRFAIDWITLKIKTDELQKQNLQGELNLLKSQISPHFFFNTLNNIDSLIKSNAEKASETLVKLSEIMRYMIYDTKVSKVPLIDEIKHIENYIDLQRIQYANKELVSFSVNGNPDNISIAPVLFISFVENAFKHCTNKNSDQAIRIQFSISDDLVKFETTNLADKNQIITKDDASGVGLDIVKRRLELLYPNKHNLTITEEDDIFKVSLSIQTNED